jgi:virginiamycin B lyase
MSSLVAALVVGATLASPAEGAVTVTMFDTGLAGNSRLYDITAGPDGNLWFTDPGANAIGRITPQGEITEFSEGLSTQTGAYPPQYGPAAIGSGSDGNLWFTEPGRNLIGRITPQGHITEFSQGLTPGADPLGITAGPDGNLWFTEPGTGLIPSMPDPGTIGRITPDGDVTEFPQRVNANGDITAGPDGNLWYVASNGIGRMTPQGDATLAWSHEGKPVLVFQLTSGPDGNVWFTEVIGTIGVIPKIGRLTPQGALTEFRPGGPGTPVGIASGSDGNLWFAKDDLGIIGRITPQGAVTEFCHGMSQGAAPSSVTTGPDGNVWFVETSWLNDDSRVGRVEVAASDAIERPPSSYIVYPPRKSQGPRYVLGRACDDEVVTQVGVSVIRHARARRGPRCAALSPGGRWLRYGRTRRGCRPRFLLSPRPRTSWRLRLPIRLGEGHYTITSRATDSDGQREASFNVGRGNVRPLSVPPAR